MLIVNAEGEGYDEKLRGKKDVFSPVGLSKYYEKIVVATRQLAEIFTDLKTAVDHGKMCGKAFFSFGFGLLRYYEKFVSAMKQVAEITGLKTAVDTVIGQATALRENYSPVTYESIVKILSELRKPRQRGRGVDK